MKYLMDDENPKLPARQVRFGAKLYRALTQGALTKEQAIKELFHEHSAMSMEEVEELLRWFNTLAISKVPYPCQECDTSFNGIEAWRVHQKKVHGFMEIWSEG